MNIWKNCNFVNVYTKVRGNIRAKLFIVDDRRERERNGTDRGGQRMHVEGEKTERWRMSRTGNSSLKIARVRD